MALNVTLLLNTFYLQQHTRGWTPLATGAATLPMALGAGVAGAITSTARQVGAAVGIAVAGGLIAGDGPVRLAAETRPGWLLVSACGLFLLVVARAAGPRTAHPAQGASCRSGRA